MTGQYTSLTVDEATPLSQPPVARDFLAEMAAHSAAAREHAAKMAIGMRATSPYPERIVLVDPAEPVTITMNPETNQMVARVNPPTIASRLPTEPVDLEDLPEYNEPDAPSACGEWAVVGGLAAVAIAVVAAAVKAFRAWRH